MNNIRQKNVIYSLVPGTEIPYKNPEYVNHRECCENINEIDINNLANQLVDNDLYVESFLQHASSYITGPKIYDESTISSKVDGYKAFGQIKSSKSLEILHKIDSPLSSTIQKLQSGTVKFVKKFGDLVIVNINNDTRCAYDPINGPWESLRSRGQRVDSTDVCTNDVDCFIAARDGIYQLSVETYFDENAGSTVEKKELVKLNPDSDYINATCIAVDKKTSKVYVGTEDQGVLIGQINRKNSLESNAGKVQLQKKNLWTDKKIINDHINDIEILDNSDVVVAGNSYLYTQDVHKNLQNLQIYGIDDNAISFNQSIQYNEKIFFGSSNGLWQKENQHQLRKIQEIGDLQIVGMSIGNSTLFVATTNKIFSINRNFEVRDCQFGSHGEIRSIGCYGKSVIVATSNSLLEFDGSLSEPYVFSLRDEIPDIKTICINDDYLVIAGETAISSMLLTQQNSVEIDAIKSLDEVQIVGIDGSSGNSGFLKFINAKGSEIAVFTTKLFSLSGNKAKIAFFDILDAISLETDEIDDFQYIVVSTSGGTFVVKYDGIRFTVENQLVNSDDDGDFTINKLIQFKTLVVGTDFSKNSIFYWPINNIGEGKIINWTRVQTYSPFNDLETCGLCAIGQVESDGISGFYQVATSLSIGQLSAVDACAETELSTQFICTGTTRTFAYVLSALKGDGHHPAFSTINVGGAITKKVQTIKFVEDDFFYMYALNASGNPYIYQLENEYGWNPDIAENILTGFSSTPIDSRTDIQMTDLQKFFDPDIYLDGILFSGQQGIYTHFYSYSQPEKIHSDRVDDLAIFTSQNEEGENEYSLMFTSENKIVVSSLTMDDEYQVLTAFTDDEADIDRICIGSFCFFSHNAQKHVTIHYEQNEAPQHEVLEMDSTGPAEIDKLMTFRSSWVGNDDSSTAYDILIAAVGNTLHATWFNGETQQFIPLSQTTTKKLSFVDDIVSLDFQKQKIDGSSDDGPLDLYKVVVATARSFHLVDVILKPKISNACQIQFTNRTNFYLDEADSNNIVKACINNDQTIIYITEDGHAYRKQIIDEYNNLSEEATLIASNSKTIVKITKINDNGATQMPDVWCQTTDNMMFSCTTRMFISTPEGKTVNSLAQSNEYGTFIGLDGLDGGIYETDKKLDLDTIELNRDIDGGAKAAAFANGIVFAAGDVGLSCFQYSYPKSTSSPLIALNRDIEFHGLFADAVDSTRIKLVAWSENKIYSRTYDLDQLAEDSFGYLHIDKIYPELTVDTLIKEDDQLKIENDGEDINIFMLNFNVENTDDRYVFLHGSDLYWDLNQFSLRPHIPDSSTKMQKFIQDDESGDYFDYLSLDKKSIIRYPDKTDIMVFSDPIDDAIRSNGIWYVKKSGQWMYGKDYLPEFDGKTIDVSGVSKINGITYVGSDYGVLSATHYRSAVVSENLRYPLTKNSSFTGAFESLNRGNSGSFVLVTRNSENKVHAYTMLEKSSSLEEIVFLAPFSAENLEVPAQLEHLWIVNGQYLNGVFCYPSLVEPDEDYMHWLNRIDGKVLYPFTNVDGDGINSISHHQGRFYILKDGEVIEFTSYGDEIIFHAVDGSHTTEHVYSHITPVDGRRALVVGKNGICMYSSKNCSSLKSSYVESIEKHYLDGNPAYIHNDGSDILTSLNYKIWRPLLSLPDMVIPNDIAFINKKTYLFSTNDGLYGTKYKYIIVNDVKPISRETVLEIYNDLISSNLSTQLDTELENHLSTHHLSGSFITRLNEDYATTQLDDIMSSWQSVKISSSNAMTLGIKNDIITEMHFGGQNDGDVIVQISNYLDDEEAEYMEEISGATYITKRWMSGITEMYINIPTTRTYYLNNLYGASNCRLDPEMEMSRKNLENFGVQKMNQNGVLSTHYTTLKIGIASAEYSITQLLDIQINGMSLPLKIYQDQSQYGDAGLAGNLYRSFVEPSIVKNYDIVNTDEEGNFQFEFACFGTDAQAVHLMFYDEKSRSNNATVKIIFDPNGGEGTMAAQKFIITYDENGNPVLEQKNLKRNKFTNFSAGYQKIFAGWSMLPLMDNEEATYEDMKTFPNSSSWNELCHELNRDPEDFLKHKDQITLYAVWLTYQFSEDDTTLMMDSNKTEFQIADVGIDESTKLKDKVVINWGD